MNNILVIEEESDFRNLLCKFIRDNNFHVIEARNIFMGSYLARDQYPDLIICSLEIVEEIGYNTFQKMYENSTFFQIPFMFLTKSTDISYSFKKINQLGSGILLRKTVEFSIMLKTIQAQLAKKSEVLIFLEEK
jgi:DNA-binding response OmpR family regulator